MKDNRRELYIDTPLHVALRFKKVLKVRGAHSGTGYCAAAGVVCGAGSARHLGRCLAGAWQVLADHLPGRCCRAYVSEVQSESCGSQQNVSAILPPHLPLIEGAVAVYGDQVALRFKKILQVPGGVSI